MRGIFLPLALVLAACADGPAPPDLPDSPGALHNQLIEEFFRVYQGEDEIGSILEAARRVLPGVEFDEDDVRLYAREAKQLIEQGWLDDPEALTRELVRRGILPREDARAFKTWVEDPTSEAPFAHRELAEDIRVHSAKLWASKDLTDEQKEQLADTVSAFIGYELAGPAGAILGGGLGSLLFTMVEDMEGDTDDFWESWTGPIPPWP